jgi:Tfp pilus assembly protein PilV
MNKFGFTLIETVLYVAIVAVVVLSVSSLGWLAINNQVKSNTHQEVTETARFISERIGYEIRNASGITAATPSSITLSNFAPDTSTEISLTGTNVQIAKNGSNPVSINPIGTKVSDLSFTNYSTESATRNIGFTITVNQSYTGTNQLFKASTTLQSAVELRSY